MHTALYNALRKAGFDVCFIDFRNYPVLKIGHPVHMLANKLPDRIKNYLYEKANRSISNFILKKARETKPDYVLFAKAKSISIPVLKKLRKIAPTINWYPDAANNWPSIRKLVSHYDYFFVFDRSVVDTLKREGYSNVYHLPFCGDVDKFAEWPDNESHKYKVSFLGSYSPDYKKRLDILAEIKNLGLEVWGNKEWLDTPLKDQFHGPVDPPDINVIKKLYSDSKIVIHIDANTGNPEASGLTLRPFDVTSSGSMLIAQDDRDEIFDMFKDGEEFVSFHDEKDIKEKVQYYLDHEEERRKIARAGFLRTRTDHTYLDRVKRIFSIAESNSNEHTL